MIFQVICIPFCAFRADLEDKPLIVALTWTNTAQLGQRRSQQFSVSARRLHSLSHLSYALIYKAFR